MSAEIVKLLTTIAIILFPGWSALALISYRKKTALPEMLFLSYGLGIGLISVQMLLSYFFRQNFSIAQLILPWAAILPVSISLYIFGKDKSNPKEIHPAGHGNGLLSLFLVFGVSFEVLYAFFRALIKPIESYDAVAIYAIKAKMIYLAGALTPDFFNNLVKLFPHPDYPLNIPLAEAFIYISLGGLNDLLVKIIFPLYFLSILGMFYLSIRRFASRNYALLFTFILASTPQFNNYATNAYLEIALSYYVFVSAVFLFRWLEDTSDTPAFLISAVFAGLAGWTKNEGLLYCAVNMGLISFHAVSGVFRQKWAGVKGILRLSAYLGITIVILAPWIWIKRSANIVNDEIEFANMNMANLAKQAYKIKPVLYEFQKQFFGPKKWNILWPAMAAALLVNYRKAASGVARYMALFVFLAVSGYVLFYLISNVEVAYFLGKSWSRFLIHFLPVALYWTAYTMRDEVKI